MWTQTWAWSWGPTLIQPTCTPEFWLWFTSAPCQLPGFKSDPGTENVSKGRRKGQASEFFIFTQDWKIPGFPTVCGIYSQKGQAGPCGVRCPKGSDSTVPFSSALWPRVNPLQGGAGSLGNQGLRSGNKGSMGRSGDTPALSLGDRQVGLWTLAPGLPQTHLIRWGVDFAVRCGGQEECQQEQAEPWGQALQPRWE